ncbi:MAG: hypothetical protein WA784_08210, partial [Albidovulum sp.]
MQTKSHLLPFDHIKLEKTNNNRETIMDGSTEKHGQTQTTGALALALGIAFAGAAMADTLRVAVPADPVY